MEPVREAPAVLRAEWNARGVAVEISVILATAVVLAMIGPFGTYLLGPWPQRLAYWCRTALVGYAIYRPLLWLGARTATRLGFAELAGWTAGVAAASVPMSLVLWWFGPRIDVARAPPSGAQFVETFGQTALLAALVFGLLWIIADRRPARSATQVADEAPSQPAAEPSAQDAGARLADRLPARLGREIIALGMEDHYVRVFTLQGDTLILMRMSDAVRELAGVEGAQVHRSWWVARAAVTTIERRGRAAAARLDTGLEVPVARRRMGELRQMGWPVRAEADAPAYEAS